MQKTLHFKTNTLLKNLVGKDLINDDTIAVVELVKNAHDAKSPSVLIRFEGFDANGTTRATSRLVILDKGSGMDDDDIEDKWLNIAYSEKKLTTQEDGVYFAGNKGIGRFSCDRLGEKLDLLTRKHSGELYHLKISWPDFEVEGKKDLTIQQIDVVRNVVTDAKAKELAGIEMPRHGTILVISTLRNIWERDNLLSLKRALEKFISPNEQFLNKKFDITIEAKDLQKAEIKSPYIYRVNGLVQNQIFANLRFNSTVIESEISPDGKTVKTTLSHEGETVFRLTEKNLLPLKNIKAFIYYLNPYKKAYFKRQTGVRSIDFGSIFLFLNGFRIAPYGDFSNDWLGLDIRKTQGTTRYLSSRDLVGRVEILDNEDSFKPVSSREGLKKTDAFFHLKEEYIISVIRRLEKFVVDGLNWDSIPAHLRDEVRADDGLDWKSTNEEYAESWDRKKQRIALNIMTFIGSTPDRIIQFWFNPALLEGVYEQREGEVQDLLTQVEGYDSDQVEPSLKRNLAKLRKVIGDKDEESKAARTEASNLRVAVAEQGQRLKKLAKETDTYRAQSLFLQSVGSQDAKHLLAFHHEIAFNSDLINNYIAKIAKALREPTKSDDVSRLLEKLSLANKRILAIAQFATKANFKSSTNKEPTDIPAFFEQYVVNVARDFIASDLSIDVKNSIAEPFEIKARRIELSILIDNLISNAKKAHAKRMQILISKKSENTLAVSFIDDGNGLSEEIKNPQDIFEAGVTTTSGSGLGLYHSKDIVAALGGTIKAIPLTPKGLEIRLELMR